MKKNLLIALIGILSIVGLIFVQVNLLKVGIYLEKDRFDQKMKLVLHELNYHIDRDTSLYKNLIYFYQTDSSEFKTSDWRRLDQFRDTIQYLLEDELIQKGLSIGYSFALVDADEKIPLLTSKNFFREAFEYEKYRRPIAGKISLECRCRVSLHFHANNLFNYLLGQLAYLIIPSVLFLLLMIAALFMLIYTLNQQRKLAGLKNDFINNLTHELKTPVFSISLLTKVMRENIKQENWAKLLEYVGLVEKENQQMKGHIEKVLELASLESGRYNLQKESSDIHQLLNEVIDHFLIKLSASEGKLKRSFEAVQGQISVDMVHFKNAIQNLLENALKYNDKIPEIEVTTYNEAQALVLNISDNGPGIAPEHQKHIFEKFYRITKGDLHQVKGFGLGLSYVKQIVEAHNGEISLKSQPGQGTQFFIKLPLV